MDRTAVRTKVEARLGDSRVTGELDERLKSAPIIPLIQAKEPKVAVRMADALMAGGLTVLEVVLRTDDALRCLESVRKAAPEAIVGAGTVLGVEQARAALSAGASFIVSPGLHAPVVETAFRANADVFPGVVTPGEVQLAWNLGLRTLKLFPAGQMGGTGLTKALSAAFRDVRFIPTGGVSAANLADYLQVPSVLACGGSWITPAEAVRDSQFDAITRMARQAVEIATDVRR